MAFHLNGYSNFHDDNQDWIVSKIKSIEDTEAHTEELAEAAQNSADASQASAEASQASADASQLSAEAAQTSAEDSQASAGASQLSAEAAAESELNAKEYADNIGDPVSGIVTTWLADNITPTTPIVDYSLSITGAAADAYATGSNLTILNDVISKENVAVLDGYDVGNVSTGAIANSPFIYKNAVITEKIYAVKLNAVNPGTLSIGTVKKIYAVQGTTFDRTNANVHAVLNIPTSGENLIYLKNPLSVESDEYLFIGMNTDTCTFKYGPNGVDKFFLYIDPNNSNILTPTNNSVGISFYTIDADIRKSIKSVYKNKKLSILGDSISTYAGYIPTGNASYYPAGNVTDVNDTWWMKLLKALEMSLEINNSWSGSRVTTTDGTESAGCGTRAESLGNDPDVIIVWMGINDFNNEVPIGTYNGETAIPETTTTFREAYAIMLNKVLTTYPSAEVWCCTLPQCERNAETGFPEINGNGVALNQYNIAIEDIAHAMNVKVLDHARCGLTYQNMPVFNPDNLHPNKFGHSLVANNDIRQMDNAVSTRYETE